MKSIQTIFCISIFLWVCVAAKAQRFKGGTHIALLATQVDGDEWGGYRKPGVLVGVFGNLPFEKKKTKLQMEINYAQKGSRNPSGESFRYRIALHQVEVPFLFGWNFMKGFSLEAGASFNVLASAKEFFNNEVVPPDAGGSRFYLFELGGIAGVDYLIKEHFGVSFRLNYSLSPIGEGAIQRNGRKLSRYLWNNAMLFRFYYQF
ncbi:MAG: PorT family protein [Bacteroidales bacterium]|jgi:hypothetical protein|nr:PorT family protein [Bacteroidales bacterium]